MIRDLLGRLPGAHENLRGLDVLLGAGILLVLTAVILTLPAKFVFGGILAIVAGVYFFAKPRTSLFAIFFIRIIIDLFWWVGGEGGLNLLEAFGGGVAALAAVLFYLELRRMQRIPGFVPLICYLAILVIAALRSGSGRDAAEILAKYVSPLLLMFLISTMMQKEDDRRTLVLIITIAGLCSLTLSFYHLLSGQQYDHFRQGYYRLVGGYKNLHNHALFLLTLNTLLFFWLNNTRRAWRALAAAALGAGLICMYYTYVRTALTGFAVFTLVYLVLEKRYALVGVAALAGVVLLVTNADMQDRFSDLLLVTQDVDNKRTLGSGRFGIWTSSMAEFMKQSPADQIFGLGLGGHYEMTDAYANLFRSTEKSENLDSHNDYLGLLYQLGPIATLSYIALQVQVFIQGLFVHRSAQSAWSRRFGAFMVALCSVTVITNFLSNSYIQRVTVAWLFWGLVGVLFAIAIVERRRLALEGRPEVVKLA